MKIAVMQPYFFPYIGYFQLINAVDKFIFFDDVNFIKRGWINRNNILMHDKPHLFSIPCAKVSSNKKINEMEVDENKDWREEFLKKILHAYSRAPYYKEVYPLIERTLNFKSHSISNIAKKSVSEVLEYLDIKKEIVGSTSIYDNSPLKGEERIIDICKKEKADVYINPQGGLELYSKEKFAKENIKLNFLRPRIVKYTQFSEIFTPFLSMIDVLMFNSKDDVKKILNEFDFIQ